MKRKEKTTYTPRTSVKQARGLEDYLRVVPRRDFFRMVSGCPMTTPEKRDLCELFKELKEDR